MGLIQRIVVGIMLVRMTRMTWPLIGCLVVGFGLGYWVAP
jgi:hypothetical protein